MRLFMQGPLADDVVMKQCFPHHHRDSVAPSPHGSSGEGLCHAARTGICLGRCCGLGEVGAGPTLREWALCWSAARAGIVGTLMPAASSRSLPVLEVARCRTIAWRCGLSRRATRAQGTFSQSLREGWSCLHAVSAIAYFCFASAMASNGPPVRPPACPALVVSSSLRCSVAILAQAKASRQLRVSRSLASWRAVALAELGPPIRW